MNKKSSILLTFALQMVWAGAFVSAQDGCVRGDAKPVFRVPQATIERHQFKASSRTEAVEEIWLKLGEFVRITHTGCEDFTVVFRIESAQLLVDSISPATAFRDAARELRKLHMLKPDLPFRLDLAASTLDKVRSGKPGPTLMEKYPVEGDGVEFLQARVLVDKVHRTDRLGVIEVALTKGPL